MTRKPQTTQKSKLQSTVSTRPLDMMALEPRILLDAAGFVTGAELAADAVMMEAAEFALAPTDYEDGSLALTDEQIAQLMSALEARDAENTDPDKGQTTQVWEPIKDSESYDGDMQSVSQASALYVVDSSVQGYEDLIAGLPEGADVLVIEAGQDGMSVLAEALENRRGISELHILSHGAAGEMSLGTATLTADSIAGEHADELAIIRGALSADGDILIYGCDFGQDSDAMTKLAEATGADIAASNDDTGAAALGGDWTLESQNGEIEADIFASAVFSGILADQTITTAQLTAALTTGDTSVSVAGSDGNTVTVEVTSPNDFLVDDGVGVGMGRDFGATDNDALPGNSETYEVSFDQGVSEVVLTFGFLNNNIDGSEEIQNFQVFDVNGIDITALVAFTFVDSSGPVAPGVGGGPMLFGTRNGVENTLYGGAEAGNADTNGVLTITSTGAAIGEITFNRITLTAGQTGVTGAFGTQLQQVEYTTAPAPPTIDLDVQDSAPIPGQNGFTTLTFGTPTDTGFDGESEQGNNGDGEYARYSNVGTVNGQTIDVVATVVRFISDTTEFLNAAPAEAADNPQIDSNNGDARVLLGNAATGTDNDGTVEIRWDVYLSGTDIPVTGNFAIVISDLDAGASGTGEEIAVYTDSLDSFIIGEGIGTDAASSGFGSDIIVEDAQENQLFTANDDPNTFAGDGIIRFRATDGNANAQATSQANSVQLNFTNTSEFTTIHHRDGGAGGYLLNANFGTAFFDTGTVVDTNPDYSNVFTSGDAPVSLSASSLEVTSDGNMIAGATVNITNAQANDFIAVTGTLPGGITVDSASTHTNIILTGNATADEYEQAIQAITFENTASIFNVADREIEITVTDGSQNSNIATTIIQMVVLPVDTDGDGVADVDDIDDDNDGILDSVEDGFATTTETIVLFDFDEANAINGDADEGFTSRASFGGANAILVHSVTGVNGNGENNGNGTGRANNARFNQIAAIATPGVALDADFLGADFTRTFGERTVTVNGVTDGTFVINNPNGAASLDGNGFIGGFDRLNNPTDIISPTLTAEQTAAFEFGRTFSFDHLNFSADEREGQNNFNTSGLLVTFFANNGDSVSAVVSPDFNLTASGQFQTLSIALVGESFGVSDAELQAVLSDLNNFVIQSELIGAASSTDTRNSTVAGDDIGEVIDRIERFAIDNIRITSDSDGDGIINSLDIDSDNDGITDNIEAQTTVGYIAPNADTAATFALNNGLNSAYVPTNGLTPVNTDGTDGVDFLDVDSDNDFTSDTVEAGLGGFTLTGLSADANDADGDGLFDVFETQGGTDATDGFNVNESLNAGAAALPDADGDAAGGVPLSEDVDFRDAENFPDTDGDGVTDDIDIDDDNDGILDTVEFNPSTLTPTFVSTTAIASSAAFSNPADTADGLINIIDGGVSNGFVYDTFSNPINPTFEYSLVVPSDEIATEFQMFGVVGGSGSEQLTSYSIEVYDSSNSLVFSGSASSPSVLANGQSLNVDGFALGEGIYRVVMTDTDVARGNREFSEVRFTTIADTDSDGIANHLDLDSDNDGISDLEESGYGALDTNNDGVIDDVADATLSLTGDTDQDGLANSVEINQFGNFIDPAWGNVNFDVISDEEIRWTNDVNNTAAPDGTFGRTVSGLQSLPTITVDGVEYVQFEYDVQPLLEANRSNVNLAIRLDGVGLNVIRFPHDVATVTSSNIITFGGVILSDSSATELANNERATISLLIPAARITSDNMLLSFEVTNNQGDPAPRNNFSILAPQFLLDTDQDGVADYLDLDSDGDFIADAIEARATNAQIPLATLADGAAADAADSDNDGVLDVFEGTNGTHGGDFGDPNDDDADGAADYIDTDTDGDGISDATESDLTALPTDVTYFDADGTIDVDPATAAGLTNADSDAADLDFRSLQDTDGDGVADITDVDDDNDGILDIAEQRNPPVVTPISAATGQVNWTGDTDTTVTTTTNATRGATAFTRAANGFVLTEFTDPVPVNEISLRVNDMDRAAVGQAYSVQLIVTGVATTQDFEMIASDPAIIYDPATGLVTIPSSLTTTGGSNVSVQFVGIGNNTVESVRLSFAGGRTQDLVGINVSGSAVFLDSDSDGISNHLDLDSDNDGITDNIEAQATANYIAPSGIGTGITDLNQDGLDDNYDSRTVTAMTAAATEVAGGGLTPVDTDGDGEVDYLDTDSDNEGDIDTIEAGLTGTATGLSDIATNDADGDGLFNVFETQNGTTTTDGFNVNESIAAGALSLPDSDGDVAGAAPLDRDVDFRDASLTLDTDGDGIFDSDDSDDDNDGILDVEEYNGLVSVDITDDITADMLTQLNAGNAITIVNIDGIPDLILTITPSSVFGATFSVGENGIVINHGDFEEATLEFTFSSTNPALTLGNISFNHNNNPIEQTGTFPNSIEEEFEIISTSGTVLTPVVNYGDSTEAPNVFAITDGFAFEGNWRGNNTTQSDVSFEIDFNNATTASFTVTSYNYGTLAASQPIANLAIVLARDSDADGVSDHLDLDSDNDGISDLEESGSGGLDANNDGVLDEIASPTLQAVNDLDDDGLLDSLDNGNEVTPRQSDADGVADYLDLDSDGDGIADAIEARPTADGNVITSNVDSDDDGVLDHFDTTNDGTFGGNFIAPVDTDSALILNNNPDGLADYIDTDSDGDGILDRIESGLPTVADLNGDGIGDNTNFNVSYADADGSLAPSTGLDNFVGDTSEVAYRELNQPVIIDLNDDATTADRDHQVDYVIGGTAVDVVASDGVFDADSTTIRQLTIDIDEASFVDGASEILTIAGVDVQIDPTANGLGISDTAVVINGSDYILRVVSNPGIDLIMISLIELSTQNDGDGQILLADAQAFLAGISYRNDQGENATAGDRIYTVRAVADQSDVSLNSNTATGTITVIDPAPIIDLNDDNTTAELDNVVTYAEGDGAVNVALGTADAIDPSNNITELAIDLAGFADAGDESLSVNSATITPGTDLTDTSSTIDGVPVTISLVGGTLTVTATDGTSTLDQTALDTLIRGITYTHGSDDPTAGDRTLSFTATDAGGNTTAIPAVATLTVVPVNDAPDAMDDAITTNEDEAVEVTVRGNDTDPESDPLTVTSVTQGTNGTVAIDPVTGNPVYTPDADFNGTDTFTYTVDDGNGGTDTATVIVTVDPVNDAPITVMTLPAQSGGDGQAVSPLDVSAAFDDVDGDTLGYTATGLPTGLTIDPVTGIISGTPAADASQGGPNSDGVYEVTVTATDPDGELLTTTFTYTLTNPAPVVDTPIGAQMADDADVISIATDMSDPDGDTLSYTVSGLPTGLTIDPATGEITGTLPSDASQSGPAGDGVYIITVTGDDGESGTVTDTFTLTVANPAPDAIDDAVTTNEDTPIEVIVRDNDSDPDGDVLTVTAVTQGTNGTVLIDPVTGNPVYTPNADFNGTDTFTYTVDDGNGGTDTATVIVTVDGVNDGPVVVGTPAPQTGDDAMLLLPLDVSSLFSDTDGDVLSYSSPDLPVWMQLDPVTGELTGTPPADASQTNGGDYLVTVTATDPSGESVDVVIAYAISNVAPVVDTPTADLDALDDETLFIPAAMSDADGDRLTYTATGLPDGLSIISTTGEIVGTIDNSASQNGPAGDGVYTITRTVDDGEGGPVSETFTLTVSNPGPDAVDDNVAVNEGESRTFNVILGSDTDPDQDDLTITQVNSDAANLSTPITGSAGGSFTVNPDGSVTFDANGDFDGLDVGETVVTSVTYTVSDGEGGTDTATVFVTVNGTNDAPVSSGPLTAQTGTDGESLTPYDASTVFSDVDAEPLTYFVTDAPSWLSIDPVTGVVSGSPPSDASQGGPNGDGVYAVTVTVTDLDGESVSEQLILSLSNTDVVATDDGAVTPEDTAVSGNILDNDTDDDGDVLTVEALALPDGSLLPIGSPIDLPEGVLTVNADGSYSFDPAPDYNGTLVLGYTVTDSEDSSDMGSFTIEVSPETDNPRVIDPVTGNVAGNPDSVLPEANGIDNNALTPIPTSQVFVEPDGEALSFSLSNAPDWLSIDPVTGEVSGMPPGDASQGGPNGDGVYEVTVTATDASGNPVSTTLKLVLSNTPPDAVADVGERMEEDTSLTLDLLTNDVDPDGDELTISEIDGQPVTVGEPIAVENGTVVVDADGRVTFTPDVDYVGQANFTYTVSDGQDGTDTASVSIEVFADVTPPEPPVVNPPTQTPEGLLTVTGTGEPGGTAKVTFPDGSIVEVPVDADGNWTATSETVSTSGDVTVVLCDDDGNESPPVTETYTDVTSPIPTIITSVDQTPDGRVTVTGTGEPGATVTVCYPNGDKVDVVVDENGEFSVTSETPQETGEISLLQTDEAGNPSDPTTFDYVDDLAPLPPVITDVTTLDSGLVQVGGTAEPGSTVTVTLPDGTVETVTAGPDGTWSLTSKAPQPNGDIVAIATDASGNESGQDDAAYDDQIIDRPILPEGTGEGLSLLDASASDGGYNAGAKALEAARERDGHGVVDAMLGAYFADGQRQSDSLAAMLRGGMDTGYRGGTVLAQVPGGECGLIQIDAVAGVNDIVIGFTHVANAGCFVDVKSWSVEGASLVGPDAVILPRYEGRDARTLTIRAHMENGQVVRIPVEVNLTTGRLTRTGQTAMGAPTLDMQFAEMEAEAMRPDPVLAAMGQ